MFKLKKQYFSLIENFSYLALLQVFNVALPIIIFPFLISSLGTETYGLVVFAQAIIGYLVLIVNFGFDLSAAKDISIARDKQFELNSILSSVFILKLILLFISFVILFILLNTIAIAKGYELLFFLTMGMAVADVLIPNWYFQGIEKMKFITLINTINKVTYAILIFIFIKNPGDYLLVPLFNGIGSVLAGCIALYLIFYKHRNRFFIPDKHILIKTLKNSFPLFLSNLSIKIYVSSSKVIIGAFLGMSDIAFYDLAEKLVAVLKLPQYILGQVILPKVSFDKDFNFVRRIFKFSLIFNLLLYAISFFAVIPVVHFLGKGNLDTAISISRILLLTVPIIGVSNYFGIQILLPLGHHNLFSRVIGVSALVYLLQFLMLWLFGLISIYSISIIAVTTELFVSFGMFYYYKITTTIHKSPIIQE